MIREAIRADIPDMIAQAHKFAARVGMDASDTGIYRVASAAILHGVALVAETREGIVGFIIGMPMYNPNDASTVMLEQGWWSSDNRAGGLLLRAFEQAAKERGCSTILIGVLRSAGEAVHSSMLRMGYEDAEVTYRKKI